MPTDPDLLLKMAKSRLRFIGNVTMKEVSKSDAASPEFGSQMALTSSNADCSQHMLRYVAGLSDDVFFHEFCHMKLNEIGFKKAESKIEKEHDKESNRALIFIAEVYANALLFRHFKSESKSVIEQLDCDFLLPDSLRRKVQRGGYAVIAIAAGYSIAKMWNGFDDEVAMCAVFKEAFGRNKTFETYNELRSVLSTLPPIRECDGTIQKMTSNDVDCIVGSALELSKIEKEWKKASSSRNQSS